MKHSRILGLALAVLFAAALPLAAQSYLVVTRTNTPEAVKAALDAAASLTNGEGITASGGVASFTDTGETMRFRGADFAAIWPVAGPAPYAWFVAPEGDPGVFTVYHGGATGATATEIAQRLLIDGTLYRIGSVQVPSGRPANFWSVGLNRTDPVTDVSGRTVEIPADAKVRVARAAITGPVLVVDSQPSRRLLHSLAVYDNRAKRWEHITVAAFLRDIYTEPDGNTRYFALKETDTFVAADFLAGAIVTGLDSGVAAPDVTGITAARLAVAVPVGVPFDYFSAGLRNGGYRSFTRSVFTEAPVDTIDVDGVSVNVHLSHRRQSTLIFSAGVNVYFDRDSTNP